MSKTIYLFYGEEDYLAAEQIAALKAKIANPALNIENLEGKSLTLESLSAALQTSPMFGGEKLVIINNPDSDLAEEAGFAKLLNNISPEVKVVFQAQKVDKRSKFYKLLAELGEVIECKPFAPWEEGALVQWVEQQAQNKISPTAARALIEISGNNLRALVSEIEKLITYVGEGKRIEEQDVLALASPGARSVFELADAVRQKNASQTLKLFQSLLKNKVDFFQLLGLLASQYRLMLQLKSTTAQNQIKGSPYYIRKCSEQLGKYSLDELKNNLEQILIANMKLKTGEAQPITMELLLTSLCGK